MPRLLYKLYNYIVIWGRRGATSIYLQCQPLYFPLNILQASEMCKKLKMIPVILLICQKRENKITTREKLYIWRNLQAVVQNLNELCSCLLMLIGAEMLKILRQQNNYVLEGMELSKCVLMQLFIPFS